MASTAASDESGTEEAEAAYRRVERLTAIAADVARRASGGVIGLPAPLTLALRVSLHPALAAYRTDPLLPLAGEFISLDARIHGLLAFAARHDLLSDLRADLGPDDREALRAIGAFPDALSALPERAERVGESTGALYLPAGGRAVVCRVRALYAPSDAAGGALAVWPDPEPVRPVSDSVQASARAALAAALHVASLCPEPASPLFPAPLWFDVSGPFLTDGILEATAGDSLGLPLALAFLSALTGVPLPQDVAATGAVGGSFPDALRAVAHIREKLTAVLKVGVSRFFAPAGTDVAGVTVAESVQAVARALSPVWAELLNPPPEGAEVPPPAGGPDGITFVATEIEGAARLWQTEPGAMRGAAADHARLVRAALVRQGGWVFKERIGDGEGFLAAFAGPGAACAAAVAAQRALRRHLWPREIGPLAVRAAVHRGSADLFKGDYFGPALGQTRRVLEAGNGGQILVTAPARAGMDDPAWRWSDLGRHRLRDLAEPVELWQLSAPDLPDAFEPPRTLDSLRHNLPVQETPLLGRDAEVAMLSALLTGRSQRLITLLGPGGVGKTRLSLQAAADAVESFPDGVYFVSVEEANPTPEGVAAAVADALRLSGGGLLRDPVQGVLDAVAGRRVLLVLDNFESVLPDGAGFVSRLLARAPEAVCVVTSRALLLLSAERRFDVTPLALPAPDADENEVRAADAVALFCARARAARPDFDPRSEDDLRLLADVCRRLDGLPLAMELAAARLRHLTLAELGERLKDAFSVLTTRLRDVPPRHRTLQGTLEWSYDLLDPTEQRMLRAVSVFAGGFSGRAAESVSGDGDALDLLAALEDKSLVVCRAEDSGEARFHLLNLIDEFAARKLREAGEADAARAAHARWFAALAAGKGAAARTPDEVAAFDVLEAEMDNLRAAFAYLRDHAPGQLPEYVAALADFLRRRGHAHERREWPRAALGAVDAGKATPSAPTCARLYHVQALLLRDAGETKLAKEAAHQALELGRECGDEWTIAEALNSLGLISVRDKDYREANRLFKDAQLHYCQSDRAWLEGIALTNLGYCSYMQEDKVQARYYYEKVREVCGLNNDLHSLAYALNNLGLIAHEENDYQKSRSIYSEYLFLCRKLKDSTATAIALLNLGDTIQEGGDPRAAAPLLVAAKELLVRLGHRYQAEAEKYVEQCSALGQEDYVAGLRKEFARRAFQFLLAIEPDTPTPLLRLLDSDNRHLTGSA